MRKAVVPLDSRRPVMALRRLLVLLAAIGVCRAARKHWMVDVDWDNPANWQGGVPRLDSRVVFPEGMRHAVGMPYRSDASFTGLELPWDGIVALPEYGKITLSEKANAAKSVWARQGPYFWVDPQNWNGSSEAVPHMERVPCQGDIAVLPSSTHTFSMRLPESRIVEVAGINVGNSPNNIPRWLWPYMSDHAEFLGSSFSIRYSPLSSCEDCNCQEGDVRQYWEEVCNVQRPRCGRPTCLYPLQVEGHCCYYCGGRVRLSKATLLNSAQRVAASALAGYDGQLFWHSRRTWDGQVEILITERGYYEGSNVIIAIADLQAALKEDGLDVLYTETSGEPLYDYRLALALGPFLGGFLALFVLVLLVFPVFGYTYSQVWDACREVADSLCGGPRTKAGRKRRSIAFARFENAHEGNVQLAEEEVAAASGGGERFENPLYEPRRKLDPGEPVSLVALARAAELDRPDDVDMDIENL